MARTITEKQQAFLTKLIRETGILPEELRYKGIDAMDELTIAEASAAIDYLINAKADMPAPEATEAPSGDADKIREALEAAGGSYWAKAGRERVYFNAAEAYELAGGTLMKYKTGNISYAELPGIGHISNSKASVKAYYDLVTGEVVAMSNSQEVSEAIRAALVDLFASAARTEDTTEDAEDAPDAEAPATTDTIQEEDPEMTTTTGSTGKDDRPDYFVRKARAAMAQRGAPDADVTAIAQWAKAMHRNPTGDRRRGLIVDAEGTIHAEYSRGRDRNLTKNSSSTPTSTAWWPAS